MKFTEYIKNNYTDLAIDDGKIEQAIQGIRFCIQHKVPIFCLGNGGSLYTASHFAQDLQKACNAIAFCLGDNSGLITAIANDHAYEYIFASQLPKFGKRYLLVCISHSGNSRNVINAAERSYWIKSPVLSLTGSNGGKLTSFTNLEINIPSGDIYFVEGMHSLILHFIIQELSKKSE